ncbi:hypothetical protein D9599_19300 [Roseomonas sp. KE2513]|uniref:hypothetical protein n=1 Tax=Roseomonas sp. KE2513 TaxID=2479202 RepID=UPI0018DF2B6B|nr:hypothetical protein [Roseomonas sp. KE2513]MBI0537711.1 hypothetical protein [Roseomonas sp. KE2513]
MSPSGLKVRIEVLEEPPLSFGAGQSVEPRKGLAAGGPAIGVPSLVNLGLVTLQRDVEEARSWLEGLNRFEAAHDANARRFPRWPGAPKALGTTFRIEPRLIRTIDDAEYAELLLRRQTPGGFEALLEMLDERVKALLSDQPPSCVVIYLPDELAELRLVNPALSPEERRLLEALKAEEESDQLSLFQPTSEEKEKAEALRATAEELLYQSFYRALKTRAMFHQNAAPLQILRYDTVRRPNGRGQSRATRAWNMATTLLYKCGGIPWRPTGLPRNVCFVGISFHHIRRRTGGIVYASVAQAVSTELEPFAIKGAEIDQEQRRDRRPYLTADQAAVLIADVVVKYRLSAGVAPDRVVVHKTSGYEPEEVEGFRRGAQRDVAACDLVWLRETSFRLIRRGAEEPVRGTFCTIGDESYLFTVGRLPWWGEYPGPHIPAPLEIGSAGSTDLRERALEILALSKMDWNSTEGVSRYPITVGFARKVGLGMSMLSENQAPNPSYRFHA